MSLTKIINRLSGIKTNPEALINSILNNETKRSIKIIKGLKIEDLNVKHLENEPAIVFAAKKAMPRVVTALIDAGADIKAKDNDGNSALHYSAQFGDLYNIQTLDKKGLDIREANNNGHTPRTIARKNFNNTVEELLKNREYEIARNEACAKARDRALTKPII